MEVMMRLGSTQMSMLKEDFMKAPDGLPLDVFVQAMLKNLTVEPGEDMVALVRDLCEMFAQVCGRRAARAPPCRPPHALLVVLL
jgi:hypothetical protein